MIKINECIVHKTGLISSNNVSYKNSKIILKDIDFESFDVKIADNNLYINKIKIDRLNIITKDSTTNIGHGKTCFIFDNCIFSKEILITGQQEKEMEFKECEISSITIEKIAKAKNEYSDFKFMDCKNIDKMHIKDCHFNCVSINNLNTQKEDTPCLTIEELVIEDSMFHFSFQLYNCDVKDFTMYNTRFLKKADFFKCKFDKKGEKDILEIKRVTFDDLTFFGSIEFEKFTKFNYVTFQGSSHFKSAHFKDGLDLEYAHIEKEMNFFNIKIDEKTHITSQETYRIIKYQLNKVGNIIDANKYHSQELKGKWRNLKFNSEGVTDWIVLFFHFLSSNYSRNWNWSLAWIIIVGAVTSYFMSSGSYDSFLEATVSYMSIINLDEDMKAKPFIFFTNKVFLGYLYYQFLTAIRKDTKINV